MKLGAFSISLAVKNLAVSKEFYEKLGFVVLGGDISQNYLVMKNDNSIIGLFQGMFEGNILTFNPGWNENAGEIAEFTDVRELESELETKGIAFIAQTDKESKKGPASFMITDPDGNIILVDQHR